MRKIHKPDPGNPDTCTCGYTYPAYCRGGHPILTADTGRRLRDMAADGVPFTRIAAELNLTVHIVRRIVHG
jgi:hypothetical protein